MLVVVLMVLMALLALGSLLLLGSLAEVRSSGQARFNQAALYAAESGVSAGVDFLRTNCASSGGLFTAFVSPANGAPQSPAGIVGNGVLPGESGNPFDATAGVYYEVAILNNPADPGLAAGTDSDGTVIVRATGHGPNQTSAVIEAEVTARACVLRMCETAYAQRSMDGHNEGRAICSSAVTGTAAGNVRTLHP